MKIAGQDIGRDFPPYIIAELSANHNGSLESAKQLILEAKRAGADAVKLQTYSADTITLDSDREEFKIKSGLWKGRTLYELYKSAEMPWDWHKPLFDFAKKQDITIFSSPFDFSAVDLLEDLGAPAYKIASFEIVDIPLIKYAASTGKPLIISTGMADKDDINNAVTAAREAGCKELAILHCVSGYPALSEDYNLKTLVDMQSQFNLSVGLSDHTLSNATAIASVVLGACIIEKHFTLDRNGGGADDSFSLEPDGLRDLCEQSLDAWKAIGDVEYNLKGGEKENIKYRRSLYVSSSLKKGEVFTSENCRSVRPALGLAPKEYENILGRKALFDIEAGTPLSWDLIEDE